MMTKRQITLDEWDEYEWVDTSVYDEEGILFLRARHKVDPPDDGFKYVEQNLIGDAETRWVPALTFERVEGVERIEKAGMMEPEKKLIDIAKDAEKESTMSFDGFVEIICKPTPEGYLKTDEEAQDFVDGLIEQYREAQKKHGPLVQDISVERVYEPNQWGLCKFHPLSFGAGFLLSSLFWLIIGIAIGVLSR